MMAQGKLFIISGASGVGKGTMLADSMATLSSINIIAGELDR